MGVNSSLDSNFFANYKLEKTKTAVEDEIFPVSCVGGVSEVVTGATLWVHNIKEWRADMKLDISTFDGIFSLPDGHPISPQCIGTYRVGF